MYSILVKSKFHNVCLQSMTPISYHQVELIWVPVHQDTRSSEKADESAVGGSSLDKAMTCNNVVTPLVVFL